MICMDALANCAILPCGHICGCLGCMQDLRTRKCPICRGPVTNVQQVFFSALQPPKKKEFKGLRQASAQLAAPFVSYGITRVQARSALNESNGDMGEAGKKLLEMAIQSSTANELTGQSPLSRTTWTTPWLCPTCDVENLVTEVECPCCGHLRVA